MVTSQLYVRVKRPVRNAQVRLTQQKFQDEEISKLCGLNEESDNLHIEGMENFNEFPDEENKTKNRITFNLWTKWAESLNEAAMSLIKEEEEDRENAHFIANGQLAKCLIKDSTLFPLWSCIFNKQFGIPEQKTASSAPIEGEFNKLQNIIFNKRELPLRVDDFVGKHLDYLSGKMKYVSAKMEEVYDPKKLSDNDIDYEMEESLENKNKILEDLDTIQNPENNEFITFLTSIENCYLCIDVPHKCFICDKRVHLVTECSQSFELENFFGLHKSVHRMLQRWRFERDNYIERIRKLEK
ncbi:hypothetical protein JTB14_034615 [Gonioctena quinquepunctata]|nr:hypothetical protein JTB14_034615 [Gonioctena quinquepunctata]